VAGQSSELIPKNHDQLCFFLLDQAASSFRRPGLTVRSFDAYVPKV
jgi:hypothetical protein